MDKTGQAVTSRLFRRVMGRFATGVTIVTTRDPEGQPYGVTVNSFTSVSLNPRVVSICLDKKLRGLSFFTSEGAFAVNILGQEQEELSRHFATRGSDRTLGTDKVGRTGVPVVPGSIAVLECRLWESIGVGDHVILLGEVAEVEIDESRNYPLIFFGGRYRLLAR